MKATERTFLRPYWFNFNTRERVHFCVYSYNTPFSVLVIFCSPYLLLQAKKLAKQYIEIEDENTAVVRFRKVLTSRDMFFNDKPFPANESAENAFMKCADKLGARTHCPVRWRALQKWINSTKHVS